MNMISIVVDAQGVALVGIDVPDRSTNVLTTDLQDELAAVVERAAVDDSIRGVVLTSSKKTGFIAGADLKDYVTAYDRGVTASQARDLSLKFQRMTRRMEKCGKPFAAAINGTALGGGLELALACHYRVLADDPKTVVGLPEVSVGLLPGGGGTQRLPRLIGLAKAVPLVVDGTRVNPADAKAMGIVQELAPPSEVVARAREWVLSQPPAIQPWDVPGFSIHGGAGSLAPCANEVFTIGTARTLAKTQGNLPAPLAILAAMFEGTITDFDTGLKIEAKYFGQLLSGSVARNLMRTMFVNRQQAEKLKARPPGIPTSAVKRIGVLGAGMMGSGICLAAATAGIEVILIDTSQDAADRGFAYAQSALLKQVQRGMIDQDSVNAILGRIRPTSDYAELSTSQLIVEAVFESRDVKGDAIRNAERHMPDNIVFASNTSTLPITGLAGLSKNPERFIGLHFFSPAERMPLLEVIRGRLTSDETLALSLDFAAQLKKTPIIVNDSPGFYTSRVFSTFIDEGACMLAEGIEPALIENAAKMAGMPVGPLAQFDEVSQELSWKIIQQARADGLQGNLARADVAPIVEKLLALDRKGRRYAGGFYEYAAKGKKQLWAGLPKHFPPSREQPTVEEAKERLLSIQALEAARCFEDGVLTSAADADIGSVLGIGFPSWTGGTLSYIDTLGPAKFVATCERFAGQHGARFKPSAWLRQFAADGRKFHDIAAGADVPAART